MARLELRLLGGFQARLGASPPLSLPAKAQALLAYLALRPGVAHPRDKIAALLWGATTDEQARNNLRHTVFTLRKALGAAASALEVDGQMLAVDAKASDVDVPTFERLVADGTPDALERAVALYEGDLLEGVRVDEPPFEEWLLAERERLREMAVDVLTRLLAQQMQEPATERAIQTALRLVAIEPVQESVHRTLMRLYARQGRRGAALKQYQHCVAIVQRELGAEPERETRQLYQEILQRQSAEASRMSGTPAPAAPPVFELPPQETPLVGRQPELARLRAALDDAVAKRGRVVILLGEAGVGKSRMVAWLGELASQRGARMLVGHAFQTEQVLTFGPWVDGLRAAHLSADAAVLGSIDPISRAQLGCLLPELAAGSAPAVSSGPDHLRLFEAVARLLAALAADAPLVLAIEDAHWADDMTVRLLAFVARRIRTVRALLIVTAREEELATASVLRQALDELRDEPHVQSLSLGALSKPDTIALVRRLVGPGRDADRSEFLEESIWRTSEGNPFMIVETVRALAEGMHVHSPAGLLLPERVRQVIARRLEGLGHVARDVVAVAAVIGREFDFTLLQRAAALDEATTAEGLEELVRRRIVHGVGERFDFTHDRIREVAYRELLVPRRRRLHAQIAAALEDVGRGRLEEHYAALALHTREGEQWDRAARYLYLAGRQAIAYGNYGQARLFFEDAAVAIARGAGDPSLELDVYLELWVTAIEGGTPSDLETLEGKVDALARALDDRPRLAQWRVRQAQALWNVWDRERALESAVERAREAVALTPPMTSARAHTRTSSRVRRAPTSGGPRKPSPSSTEGRGSSRSRPAAGRRCPTSRFRST